MIDILILPTGGFEPETGFPTIGGLRRINKAISLVKDNQVKAVIILGGRRKSGPSEAKVYYDFIMKRYPKLKDNVIWKYDGSACCSNRDLEKGQPLIRETIEELEITLSEVIIAVTSYYEHMKRMRITLRALGFPKVEDYDSGESRGYNPIIELFLTTLTLIDPTWSWLGLSLVWMSNRRENLILDPFIESLL